MMFCARSFVMLRLCLVVGCLWSPTLLLAQEKVLHVSNATGNAEIMLITGDEEPTNLTNNPAADTYPTWSPDGKRLLFWDDNDGNTWQWMSVDLATGESKPLATLKPEAYIQGGRIAVR
jgi:Tol biopolymer transport system component